MDDNENKMCLQNASAFTLYTSIFMSGRTYMQICIYVQKTTTAKRTMESLMIIYLWNNCAHFLTDRHE